jgi:hypothetical protein
MASFKPENGNIKSVNQLQTELFILASNFERARDWGNDVPGYFSDDKLMTVTWCCCCATFMST